MRSHAIQEAELARSYIHGRIGFYLSLPSVGVRCGPDDYQGSDSLRRLFHYYVHFHRREFDQSVLLAEVL